MPMLRVHNVKHIKTNVVNHVTTVVRYYEFFCDSTSDLPNKNLDSESIIDMGSIAYVINDGDMYMMDSTGTWIKQ